MKSLSRKLTMLASTAAVVFGASFVALPKASAAIYSCVCIACNVDGTYTYRCTQILA